MSTTASPRMESRYSDRQRFDANYYGGTTGAHVGDTCTAIHGLLSIPVTFVVLLTSSASSLTKKKTKGCCLPPIRLPVFPSWNFKHCYLIKKPVFVFNKKISFHMVGSPVTCQELYAYKIIHYCKLMYNFLKPFSPILYELTI